MPPRGFENRGDGYGGNRLWQFTRVWFLEAPQKAVCGREFCYPFEEHERAVLPRWHVRGSERTGRRRGPGDRRDGLRQRPAPVRSCEEVVPPTPPSNAGPNGQVESGVRVGQEQNADGSHGEPRRYAAGRAMDSVPRPDVAAPAPSSSRLADGIWLRDPLWQRGRGSDRPGRRRTSAPRC